MKTTMVMFLIICLFTGFSSLLMSKELLELEIAKTPTFKEVGGFWYVYMDTTCPRGKMGEMVQASIQEFKKQNLKSEWVFMIFDNWPETDDGILKWKRGLVVPENTKCSPPLKLIKIEKFKALTYTLTGKITLEAISNGNHFMDDYILKLGLKRIWPIYETYRSDPVQFHFWYLVEE